MKRFTTKQRDSLPGIGGEQFKIIMDKNWFCPNDLIKETVICKVEKHYKPTFWQKIKWLFKNISMLDVNVIQIEYGTAGEIKPPKPEYSVSIDPYGMKENPIVSIYKKAFK